MLLTLSENQLAEKGRKAFFVLKNVLETCFFFIIILCIHCLILLLAVSLIMPLRY